MPAGITVKPMRFMANPERSLQNLFPTTGETSQFRKAEQALACQNEQQEVVPW